MEYHCFIFKKKIWKVRETCITEKNKVYTMYCKSLYIVKDEFGEVKCYAQDKGTRKQR